MTAAESVRQARRTLDRAVRDLEKAEADIAALAASAAKGKPIELWCKVREDGTVDSQTLRLTEEGASRSSRWEHRPRRVVRLLCYIQEKT